MLKTQKKLTPEDYTSSPAPKLEINLDLPPSQRWTEISKKMKSKMQSFQEAYESSVIKLTFKGNTSLYSDFKKKALEYLNTKAPSEYREELTGMANSLEIDLGYLLAYNFIYELRTLACSTILTCDSKNRMNMTSNLDFAYDEFYSDVTFHGIFKKNGKIVYEGNYIFGFAGFSRGHKDGISVALNARMPQRSKKKRQKGEISQHIEELFEMLETGKIVQMVYFFRKCIENSKNLEDLVKLLGEGTLGAPVYFIATDGVKGTVLERGKRGVEAKYQIERNEVFKPEKIFLAGVRILTGFLNPMTYVEVFSELFGAGKKCFYVQTNFDKDKKDYDGRRSTAVKKIQGCGGVMERQEVVSKIMAKSPNFMLQAMNKVLFRTRTISTCYLDEEDNYNVIVWKEKNNC